MPFVVGVRWTFRGSIGASSAARRHNLRPVDPF
jgi:hypothetical protein